MDFSKMNQRISFLENRTVVDEIGNHTSKWDEVYSCWASVTVKSSTETTNTGVTREIQSLSFGVRQCAFLRCVNPTTHKILFRGSVYDRLFVKADRKHQGIGTKLLEVAETYAKEHGKTAAYVHLGTPKEQWAESYGFYPKHGYAVYDAAKPNYMKKELI